MSSFRMIVALAWVCAGVTNAQAHGEKPHAAAKVVKEQKD